MESYQKLMKLTASTDGVFEALTRKIPFWWSTTFEGDASQPGATFTVRFGDTYKTIEVTSLTTGRSVVWNVRDAKLNVPGVTNPSEWIGTSISWEITPSEKGCAVKLLHEGLTPAFECYTICKDGWKQFTDSLTEFVEKGAGKPFGSST